MAKCADVVVNDCNLNAVEKCFQKNFGQRPGSRSCMCRGCYLNCLRLEELMIGETQMRRMCIMANMDLIEEPKNACHHLVNKEGVHIVNIEASRLGRINSSIVKQVLGLRLVLHCISFFQLCAILSFSIYRTDVEPTLETSVDNNESFDIETEDAVYKPKEDVDLLIHYHDNKYLGGQGKYWIMVITKTRSDVKFLENKLKEFGLANDCTMKSAKVQSRRPYFMFVIRSNSLDYMVELCPHMKTFAKQPRFRLTHYIY